MTASDRLRGWLSCLAGRHVWVDLFPVRCDGGRVIGRLQWWLQGAGYPPPYRPWVAVWVGNRISDGRYWLWRMSGQPL